MNRQNYLQYFLLKIQMFDDFVRLIQVLIELNDVIMYIENNHEVNDNHQLMMLY